MLKSSPESDQVKTQEPKTRKMILVVEDSPTQAAQIRALLVANGLRVELACDGLEGFERAKEILPELVILDLEMPRMNGYELVKALKRHEPTHSIPIIIFTKHDSPEAKALGMEEGAIDFIPKDAFAKVVMIETLKQMGFIATGPSR